MLCQDYRWRKVGINELINSGQRGATASMDCHGDSKGETQAGETKAQDRAREKEVESECKGRKRERIY